MLRKTIHCWAIRGNYLLCSKSLRTISNNSNFFKSEVTSEKSILAESTEISKIKKSNELIKKNLGFLSLHLEKDFEAIQNFSNIEELFIYLKNNKVQVPLYAPIFRKMYEIVKSNESTVMSQNLLGTDVFEQFCKQVKKTVGHIKPNDLITIFGILKKLNVPTNSYLSQHILTVLSKNVNELNLKQVCFLSTLLRNVVASPVTDALQIALSVVFEAKINQLDTQNRDFIVEAFYFAANRGASAKVQLVIVNAAYKLKEDFEFSHCLAVVFALAKLKYLNHTRKLLYSYCMARVTEEMKNRLNFKQIHTLIAVIAKAFLHADSFFYDETCIQNAIGFVIDNNLGCLEAGILMRSLNSINFQSQKLLDYVSKLLCYSEFNSLNPIRVLPFISACSDASYKPPDWRIYEEKLIQFCLNLDENNIPLNKICTELMSLDCWSDELIEKVFSEHNINKALEKGYLLDGIYYLSAFQAIKTLYPGTYSKPLLSSEEIKKFEKLIFRKEKLFTVGPALEKIFGDNEAYVVNNISTSLGHILDHVVVFSSDGRPYPITLDSNENLHELKELNIPSDSCVLGISLLPPSTYCIDGIRMRGRIKMIQKTLQKINIIPLSLSSHIWLSLRDHEKLPYLKRELLAKIPSEHWLKVSEIFTVK